MTQKTKILLVRHGLSLSNEQRTFTGQLDIGLSETGKKQAELVTKFVTENYRVDQVYSSDLSRAVDTVKGIAEKSGKSVIKEKAFREIYGGAWEGKTPEELERDHNQDYRNWKADVGRAHCSKGESFEEVMNRAYERLVEIAERDIGKTIVIGTHAGVIRGLQCKFQGVDVKDMKSVPWTTNASVTEITYQNGKFKEEKISQDHYLIGLITELKAF